MTKLYVARMTHVRDKKDLRNCWLDVYWYTSDRQIGVDDFTALVQKTVKDLDSSLASKTIFGDYIDGFNAELEKNGFSYLGGVDHESGIQNKLEFHGHSTVTIHEDIAIPEDVNVTSSYIDEALSYRVTRIKYDPDDVVVTKDFITYFHPSALLNRIKRTANSFLRAVGARAACV